MPPPQAISTFS